MVEEHVVHEKYYEVFHLIWELIDGLNDPFSFAALLPNFSVLVIFRVGFTFEKALEKLPVILNFEKAQKLEKS